MTAKVQPEERERFAKLDVDGLMAKPSDAMGHGVELVPEG